jgi:hypothetical protein
VSAGVSHSRQESRSGARAEVEAVTAVAVPAWSGDITPDSGFPALVDYWLEDMELEGRLSLTTQPTPGNDEALVNVASHQGFLSG